MGDNISVGGYVGGISVAGIAVSALIRGFSAFNRGAPQADIRRASATRIPGGITFQLAIINNSSLSFLLYSPKEKIIKDSPSVLGTYQLRKQPN
ncbi:MAG: hypothetical protein KAH12_11330, partial [Anaerolineales bacterium]|nr:hypothetical protein [Anaerolineales bacterium]